MFRMRGLVSFVLLFSLFLRGPGYSYSGGQGIQADPYQIRSAADWQILIGDPNNWGKHFVLTRDIDLGGTALCPVGNSTTGFTGHFDGNDYRIHNATIHTPEEDYVGLFGVVTLNGMIQNLGLMNIHITGNSSVGGLAGLIDNGGTILNCTAAGTVSGYECVGGLAGCSGRSSLLSSYADVTVDGYSCIGGLAGSIGSDFFSYAVNCYASGAVNGFTNVGGLVGMTWYGIILDGYAAGPVAGPDAGSNTLGGLIGEGSYSTISYCYATGMVSGAIDSSMMGSLIGWNYSTVYACFWNTETCGQPVGVGFGSEDGIYGRTTGQLKRQSTFTDYGWDFTGEQANGSADIWRMCTDDLDYPRHNRQWSLDGDLSCPDGVGIDDLAYLTRHWLEYTNHPLVGADITGDKVNNLHDFERAAGHW